MPAKKLMNKNGNVAKIQMTVLRILLKFIIRFKKKENFPEVCHLQVNFLITSPSAETFIQGMLQKTFKW